MTAQLSGYQNSWTLVDQDDESYWRSFEINSQSASVDHTGLRALAMQMLDVKYGRIGGVRDDIPFDEPQFQFPLLAGILRSPGSGGSLKVLDIGGSLGSQYFQLVRFKPAISDLRWCIVELPSLVETGRQYLQDESLCFCSDMGDCEYHLGGKPDVVLLSGVLQFVRKYREMLSDVARLRPQSIVIDRTFFWSDLAVTRLAEQRIIRIPDGFETKVPCWIFSEKDITDHLGASYFSVASFKCEFDPDFECGTRVVELRGSIWAKVPTSGADS